MTNPNIGLAHMEAALGLARRGLGRVWPNPAVGCVIAHGVEVVGRGWTQPGGRPHAETEALARAGERAKGATAYVTLEPCNHHGRTPPCTEALIGAGIARVVAAIEDPDERVAGGGVKRLADAGIEVETGLGVEKAREINEGYFMRAHEGRPFFTLKTASTLDGRIATRDGESQWITGEKARALGHLLRAEHDAVMIGLATALADNPRLTCRLPGMEDRSGPRIVLDANLELPLGSHLVAEADQIPTWVLAVQPQDRSREEALIEAGVNVIYAPPNEDGRPDLEWAAVELGGRGLTRVLVEGGWRLAASMMEAELVDQLAWFRAATVMGGDGIAAVGDLGLASLAGMPAFEFITGTEAGPDKMEIYRRRNEGP